MACTVAKSAIDLRAAIDIVITNPAQLVLQLSDFVPSVAQPEQQRWVGCLGRCAFPAGSLPFLHDFASLTAMLVKVAYGDA
jgi:hypothetical protein